MKPKRIALLGLLIAAGLVLSLVEAQLPTLFTIPGMKLGLTNVVVLLALYLLGVRSAFFINAVRILLVFFFAGNSAALAYSLAGGMLSCAMMSLCKTTGRISVPVVSIVGGVSHNIGQILAALVLLGTPSILYYLLFLWFSGILCGALIGLLGAGLLKRLGPYFASDSSGRSSA